MTLGEEMKQGRLQGLPPSHGPFPPDQLHHPAVQTLSFLLATQAKMLLGAGGARGEVGETSGLALAIRHLRNKQTNKKKKKENRRKKNTKTKTPMIPA